MSLYKSGQDIISFFSTLVKATQIYDVNNDVVQGAAKKFISYINSLFTTTSYIELLRYRDYIFFNRVRLRFEIEGYTSLQFINEKFKRLTIKSLSFLPGVSQNEIIKFASVFKEDRDSFLKLYAMEKFKFINIEFSSGEDEIPEFFQNGEQIKRSYFKALKVTKNLMQNLWTKQPIDAKSIRKVVYTLIDNLVQDETGLLALTTIKNFDEYTYNHSLNVGILALAMGERIGLTKINLVKLGTAGLLHDIGKVEIPKDLLYKIDNLTNEEWESLKLHSLYSVRQIIKTRGLDEIAISALIAAYQHHWNYDGSGYPTLGEIELRPIFYARIIRICDAFDAMTTPRPYHPISYLPPIAIRVVWERRNTYFDPTLAKIFVQLLGLYPVGSCLELSSGEIGLVITQNLGYFDAPVIKIVINSKGEKVDGRAIDLSLEKDIKIIRAVYPQTYNINPASYFKVG